MIFGISSLIKDILQCWTLNRNTNKIITHYLYANLTLTLSDFKTSEIANSEASHNEAQ